MFIGEIKLDSDYNAVHSLDAILTLVHNFKKKYEINIDNLDITNNNDDTEKIIEIDLECALLTIIYYRNHMTTIKIQVDGTIEYFNEVYNYFDSYLKPDFNIGDTVYYDINRCGTVLKITEKNGIQRLLVKQINDIEEIDKEDEKDVYASWCLKFN